MSEMNTYRSISMERRGPIDLTDVLQNEDLKGVGIKKIEHALAIVLSYMENNNIDVNGTIVSGRRAGINREYISTMLSAIRGAINEGAKTFGEIGVDEKKFKEFHISLKQIFNESNRSFLDAAVDFFRGENPAMSASSSSFEAPQHFQPRQQPSATERNETPAQIMRDYLIAECYNNKKLLGSGKELKFNFGEDKGVLSEESCSNDLRYLEGLITKNEGNLRKTLIEAVAILSTRDNKLFGRHNTLFPQSKENAPGTAKTNGKIASVKAEAENFVDSRDFPRLRLQQTTQLVAQPAVSQQDITAVTREIQRRAGGHNQEGVGAATLSHFPQ